MFTRVLTDRSRRFDEIAAGYHGALYLEVVPRTFAIRVETGLALNQVRLMLARTRVSATRSCSSCTGEHPLLYPRFAAGTPSPSCRSPKVCF